LIFFFFLQFLEEPVPDFNDLVDWPKIKLVLGDKRLEEVDYVTQWRSVKAAFTLCDILSGRATHAGRHCAAQELQFMGLAIDHLARMGRWAHSKMQAYLTTLEIPGAFAMAGFHNTRYELARDCLTPPLELQRLVFPWIEDQCTDKGRAAWKDKCDKIMLDLPESNSSIIADIYKTVKEEQPELEDGSAATLTRQLKKQGKALKQKLHSYFDIAKEGFLCLLLWFRRVIIQDAVLFIRDGATNHLLEHDIFKHQLFKDYSGRLLKAMEVNESTPAVDPNLATLAQSLQDFRIDQANHIVALRQEQHQQQEAYTQRLDRFEITIKESLNLVESLIVEGQNKPSKQTIGMAQHLIGLLQTSVQEHEAREKDHVQGRRAFVDAYFIPTVAASACTH
jgi:Centromere DNA-binding protein complex CBF3 subunit, domain 2